MKSRNLKPALDAAATRLRALALSKHAGAYVGSEEELIRQLDVSRVTLRQAARLLEREGVLQVRRGASGGYFSARPDAHVMEGALGSYLDALQLNIEETFVVGFALWAEAVRQASRLKSPEVQMTTERLRRRLDAMPPDAPIVDLVAYEDDYRRSIFHLSKLTYLELLFQLNRSVTWRYYARPPWEEGGDAPDPDFLRKWRDVKQHELAAIQKGEEDSAIAAATYDRALWQERLFATGLVSKRNL
jgi:DNA-binding FadR family transcriptional regulator